MQEITTIGLDIAKSVFQVHGIDASGAVIVRRQLRRSQVLPFFRKLPGCVIGIEACATSHHWARELEKVGHEVRLMPARYVKPYVKRNKNDLELSAIHQPHASEQQLVDVEVKVKDRPKT